MISVLLGFGGSGAKSVDVSNTNLFSGAFGPATAVTEYITVTQVGLVAPITYLWSYVSGSTAISPSSYSSPTVRFNGFVNGAQITSVWKCTVTDGVGFSQDTPNVNITLEDLNV